jgi:hypothetical protein
LGIIIVIIPTDFNIFQRGWIYQPAIDGIIRMIHGLWDVILAISARSSRGCRPSHGIPSSGAERRGATEWPSKSVGDSKVRVSLMGFNIIEHDWTNRILWDIYVYIYRWIIYVYTYMYLSNRNYLSVSKKGVSNVYFYGNMMIHRWATWRLEDLDGKRPSFATFYNFTTHLYIHIKNTLCILPAFRTKWISELTSWSTCFRRHGQDREALSSTCNWPFSLLGSRSLVHTGAAENSHRSQLGCWNGMDGLGDWIWELRQGFDWNKSPFWWERW